MEFSDIPDRADGTKITDAWFDTIKAAGETLEARVGLIKEDNCLRFSVFGAYEVGGASTGILYLEVKKDITLTSAILRTFIAGSSGNITVDLQRKRGVGAFSSLFTTLPSVPTSAGDFANSATGTGATAAVLDNTKLACLAGDILRLDQTAIPGGSPKSYELQLNYDITGA